MSERLYSGIPSLYALCEFKSLSSHKGEMVQRKRIFANVQHTIQDRCGGNGMEWFVSCEQNNIPWVCVLGLTSPNDHLPQTYHMLFNASSTFNWNFAIIFFLLTIQNENDQTNELSRVQLCHYLNGNGRFPNDFHTYARTSVSALFSISYYIIHCC